MHSFAFGTRISPRRVSGEDLNAATESVPPITCAYLVRPYLEVTHMTKPRV